MGFRVPAPLRVFCMFVFSRVFLIDPLSKRYVATVK